ncbi:hypothetical protein C498_09381 [Haloferax volcanii DS2]|uniref:Uncharacterized protein n=1 Tax=Haloferax volcanii (strain ATCC 29605 / DSM 3757 / JCM 8879 / NBRC 14742 / NCIMB 2012 / VKM B-1768 / DS2) TaxID=309800 RepID=L9V741_HALVD|nr:hypothetical protein C498_09381 [Haloferax volcanii DS2]
MGFVIVCGVEERVYVSLGIEYVSTDEWVAGVGEPRFLFGSESVGSESVEEPVVVDVAFDGVGCYGEVVFCWHWGC